MICEQLTEEIEGMQKLSEELEAKYPELLGEEEPEPPRYDYQKMYEQTLDAFKKAIASTGDAWKKLSWFPRNKL